MLKVGQRAVVTDGKRNISVKADKCSAFNILDYGCDALSNDFDNEILLRAALEDAVTHIEVLSAVRKYARYGKDAWTLL